MRKLFLKILSIYQYISKFTPQSCRYYPTCSEYSKWLYLNDNPLKATFKSILRILRCNQLFKGGIDYPIIKFKPTIFSLCNKNKSEVVIKFWLVPKKGDYYYLIKDFDGTKIDLPT